MNYKDLIDRLRESADGWDDCGEQYAENSKMEREAADVIESLTAQLAAGPVAWMYQHADGTGRWTDSCRLPDWVRDGRDETPLYAIPIPTEE